MVGTPKWLSKLLLICFFMVLKGTASAALSLEDQKQLGDLVSKKESVAIKSILDQSAPLDSKEDQKAISDLLILATLSGPPCDTQVVAILGSHLKQANEVEGGANLAAILVCPDVVKVLFEAMTPDGAQLFSDRLLLAIDEESDIQRQEIQAPRGETAEDKKEHMIAAADRLDKIGASFRFVSKAMAVQCKSKVKGKETCKTSSQYRNYSKIQQLSYKKYLSLPDLKKMSADSQKAMSQLLLLLYGPFFK